MSAASCTGTWQQHITGQESSLYDIDTRFQIAEGTAGTEPTAQCDVRAHLSCALLQGDVLVVCWLRNVASKLELRSLRTGAVSQEISLPGKGALPDFSGRREDSEMFFSYSSFTDPGSIFRCTPNAMRA